MPEAIQVFTGLTEDFPELPEPYNNLAVLYASLGNYDKAKSALELAIHTHPSYATAHENLGDIYAQLASRAYDRALQLDKNNTTAQVKLAMVKDIFVAPKSDGPAEGRRPRRWRRPSRRRPSPRRRNPRRPTAKVEPAKAEPAKPEPAEGGAQGAGGEGRRRRADEKGAVTAAIEAWAQRLEREGREVATSPPMRRTSRRRAARRAPPGKSSAPSASSARSRSRSRSRSSRSRSKATPPIAVVRQSYRSDTLKTNSTKTLKLAKVGGKWLIKQERVGG